MSFHTYNEYKNTGVEWLGKLPAHWDVFPLKAGFNLMKRSPPEDCGVVTAFRDGEVTLRSNRRMDGFTEAFQEIGYQGVEPNDLVIHAMDAFAGAIGVSDSKGKSTPVYSVCEPKKDYFSRYYGLVLRHIALAGFIQSLAKGIRERSTDFRWSDAKNIPVPHPSIEEQKTIIDFLDYEAGKIDRLVAEQVTLIELLKEKRQAVISNAVTKGLDPKVEMKDSEVEWLGKVPKHWDVVPLKYFVSMKSGEQITSEQIREEGAFPVYGGNGLRGYFEKYTHDGEYPLIGRQGALCGNINYASGKFWASEHAVVVTPQKKTNIFYIGELLRSMNLGQYSTSAAQPGLSVEAIGNLRIPAPAIDEQNQIANYLMIEAGKWESLIEAATRSISLFQERRSALISAAVTGQIDVRNYQTKEVQ